MEDQQLNQFEALTPGLGFRSEMSEIPEPPAQEKPSIQEEIDYSFPEDIELGQKSEPLTYLNTFVTSAVNHLISLSLFSLCLALVSSLTGISVGLSFLKASALPLLCFYVFLFLFFSFSSQFFFGNSLGNWLLHVKTNHAFSNANEKVIHTMTSSFLQIFFVKTF